MSFQVQLNAEVGAGRSCFPFLFGCRAKFRLPSEAGKECPDCENPTYKRYTFERDDAMQTVIGFYQGGPWGQGLSIEGGVSSGIQNQSIDGTTVTLDQTAPRRIYIGEVRKENGKIIIEGTDNQGNKFTLTAFN